MFLFERSGIEDDLACSCVALRLTIETIEDREDSKHATGSITMKDYVEHGITFADRWLATQTSDSVEWTVTKDPSDDPFWSDSQTGEVHFTANSAINVAVKQYINHWLNQFTAGTQPPSGPAEFSGEMHTYEGECVCVGLMLSTPHRPFPWEETTSGGKFPHGCFRCSCGTRWYCVSPSEDMWAVVTDPQAWELLLKFDGTPAQKIAYGAGGYVFLQQTMVDNGFVPVA